MPNNKEKVFDFAYNMAFRDATTRKAFIPETNNETINDIKINIREKVRDTVKKYIDAIFDGKIKPDSCLNTILEVMNKAGNDEFTFGNAQKLVNMTAKYMYIATYRNEALVRKFECCHCPVDGVILSKAKNNGDIEYEGKTSGWSKMIYENERIPDEYVQFQKAIRDYTKRNGKIPLDYDYEEYTFQ